MEMYSFLTTYFRMIYDLATGRRETSYPISPFWRWRHKRYQGL